MATDNIVHQLAIRAGNKLRDERLMLATAESCTGGLVAAAMTDISGSSAWFERGFDTDRKDEFTTLIDVGDYLDKRRAALLAHRTQVDPEGHWMRLPDDVLREVFPWEEFTLVRSLVDNGVPEGEYEDDLFAGLRAGAVDRA